MISSPPVSRTSLGALRELGLQVGQGGVQLVIGRRERVRGLAGLVSFVLHFTPTSSSWLNLVERWFGELTTRHPRLDRDLERRPRPYVRTKTAGQILDSIKRYCAHINDSRP